jgi:hypothetical protein
VTKEEEGKETEKGPQHRLFFFLCVWGRFYARKRKETVVGDLHTPEKKKRVENSFILGRKKRERK